MCYIKLKAGALQVTLSIVITIALLLLSFILLVHLHKRINLQSNFIVETTQLADDAIRHSLNEAIKFGDTITIAGELEGKVVKIHKTYWGIFEKTVATAQIKKYTTQKVGLVGGGSKPHRTALYIQDNNKPLVVVGNTKIEGLSYLPKQGIKPGTIAGESFYGQQLINGLTQTAGQLPKLSKSLLLHLNNLNPNTFSFQNKQFITLQAGKTYKNSFLKPTQIIYSNKAITLEGNKLIGNINVLSKTKISIDASSALEDVVLVAPEIEIKNNVEGKFQAIALREISVGKNVQLNYPSALVVYEHKSAGSISDNLNSSISQPKIAFSIEDNVTIEGVVMYFGPLKANNYQVQLALKAQSQIIGEVYCNQNFELKGTVLGSVFTNNFLAKQAGSIYQNHIYNGSINANGIPIQYAGLLFKDSKKQVVQWLY